VFQLIQIYELRKLIYIVEFYINIYSNNNNNNNNKNNNKFFENLNANIEKEDEENIINYLKKWIDKFYSLSNLSFFQSDYNIICKSIIDDFSNFNSSIFSYYNETEKEP
jgi:arginine utilization protein RocB